MYVCMYVCRPMHVLKYVCMFLCSCTHTHTDIYARLGIVQPTCSEFLNPTRAEAVSIEWNGLGLDDPDVSSGFRV